MMKYEVVYANIQHMKTKTLKTSGSIFNKSFLYLVSINLYIKYLILWQIVYSILCKVLTKCRSYPCMGSEANKMHFISRKENRK